MNTLQKIGLVGTLLAVTAAAGVGLKKEWDTKIDERQARAGLPTEVVKTRGYAHATELYGAVTEGLSGSDLPSRNEFFATVCRRNNITWDELNKDFGGKITELNLPDYDGKDNNR
jgi:hypothetical protein